MRVGYKLYRLLFIGATVLIIGLCVLSYLNLSWLKKSADWVNHTNVVKLTLEKIESSLNTAESNQRGFLITNDSSFLGARETAFKNMEQDFVSLDSLIADSKEQQQNTLLLKKAIHERIEILNGVVKNYTPYSISPALQKDIGRGKLLMQQVRGRMSVMISKENNFLATRIKNYQKQVIIAPASLFIFSIASITLFFIAFYLLTKALKNSQRLQVSEQQLEEKVKQRTKELLQRNHFVETILNASIDLIVVYDLEMRVLSFNRASERFFGKDQKSVLGKRYYEIFPGTKGNQGYSDLSRALKGESIHNPMYYSASTQHIFENFLLPLKDEHDKTYAAVVIAHDNTELIEATEKTKAANKNLETRNNFVESLLNASPDIILVTDRELRLLTINKKAAERFRLINAEAAIGQKITEAVPYLKDSDIHHDILKAIDGETNISYNRKSATTGESFIQSFIPLKNDNEVYAVMIVSHNVTELADVTTELKKTNATLEKTNEELSSFAYIASHDLQEPLRKIQMFVQRIKDKDAKTLSEQAADYFSRIEAAGRRMQQLIQDVLAYSSAGAQDKHFEKSDLNAILEQVKTDLQEKLDEKKVTIEASNLPTLVIIPFQFQQLFTNLISNSVKFSNPAVPPRINVTSEIIDGTKIEKPAATPDTDYHHIRFSDNGIGFEPRYHEQIFKLFQRLHGRNEYAGTGIGLSIVKKIVDNHNGFIIAEGGQNRGATFHIYIPVG